MVTWLWGLFFRRRHSADPWLLPLVALALATTPVPAEVTIAMVTVGDEGNMPDVNGLGAVSYTYRISVYEVTVGQYAAFLNAVATSDPHGLYDERMADNANVAGIERSGAAGSYTYRVLGSASRPITYVSWWDAARFANWMHNGQGMQRGQARQGPDSGDTERGAYQLDGATAGSAPSASNDAAFRIPTEDEWYKAALYKGGGRDAGYWRFATRSDEPPDNQVGSGPNRANVRIRGRFSVTQSPSYTAGVVYLTDVGAFPDSGSAYGTFDQNGNVQEWNDLLGLPDPARGLLGGSWYQGLFFLSARNRASDPSYENAITGFRLASPIDHTRITARASGSP
jgi:sulfatase modifying factor 1